MSGGAISLIVSAEAQAQVNELIKQLGEIEQRILAISQSGLGKKAGFVDVTSQKKLAEALAENKALSGQLAAEQEKVVKINKKLTGVLNQELSAYEQLNRSQKESLAAYNSLITKKSIGVKLNRDEEASLKQLEIQLKKNQKVYSQVQAGHNKMGISSKRTGVAFDSLGFSVAQLTRESPAFLNSVQTGFMALSNNIPIFVDEVSRLIQANKLLAQNGEQTKNVWKAVGSAFFSVQSLISVAILAITVLGPKVWELGKEFFALNDALNSTKKVQEDLNSVIKKSYEEAGKNIAQMRILDKAVQDSTKSNKERQEILNKIRKEYGDDVSHLTDMEILTNGLANAEVNLKNAIINRAKASAAAEKIGENMKRILELETERTDLITNSISAQKMLTAATKDNTVASQNNYGFIATSAGAVAGAANGATDALVRNSKELSALYQSNTKLMDLAIKGIDSLSEKTKKLKDEKPFYLEGIDPKTVGGLKALIAYNNELIEASGDKTRIEQIQAQNEELQKQLNFLLGIEEVMGKTDEWKWETPKYSFDEYDKAVEKLKDFKADLAFSIADFGAAVTDAVLESRLNAIDIEMEKIQEKYDLQKALAESEITDEASREKRLASLEKEKELKEKELNKKKKDEEKKNFLIKQAISVGEILMDAAMGIAEATAMGPATLGASLSWIPFIKATAGVQIATVLAQSIPAFKDGYLEGKYTGKALINDGGNVEVLQRKDGKLEMSTKANKIVDMKRGDIVHKDISSFISTIPNQSIIEASMLGSVAMSNNQVANPREIFDEAFKSAMIETMAKGLSSARIVNDNRAVAEAVKEALVDSKYINNL